MKPIIGITTNLVEKDELNNKRRRGLRDQDMLISPVDYSNAIAKSGGIPFLIPVLDKNEDQNIKKIVENIDGLILTGGPDVHPSLYGQKEKEGLKKTVIKRDKYELKLLKYAIELNKPVLGICKGIQLINVFFGGQLYQDINNEYRTNINHRASLMDKTKLVHKIKINVNSELSKIYDKYELTVNSFHHQAISELGKHLIITAKSEDGIIEGIQYDGDCWVVGVQWHPEMMFEKYTNQLSIFKYFINKSRKMVPS